VLGQTRRGKCPSPPRRATEQGKGRGGGRARRGRYEIAERAAGGVVGRWGRQSKGGCPLLCRTPLSGREEAGAEGQAIGRGRLNAHSGVHSHLGTISFTLRPPRLAAASQPHGAPSQRPRCPGGKGGEGSRGMGGDEEEVGQQRESMHPPTSKSKVRETDRGGGQRAACLSPGGNAEERDGVVRACTCLIKKAGSEYPFAHEPTAASFPAIGLRPRLPNPPPTIPSEQLCRPLPPLLPAPPPPPPPPPPPLLPPPLLPPTPLPLPAGVCPASVGVVRRKRSRRCSAGGGCAASNAAAIWWGHTGGGSGIGSEERRGWVLAQGAAT
jgi:hypothetical protein